MGLMVLFTLPVFLPYPSACLYYCTAGTIVPVLFYWPFSDHPLLNFRVYISYHLAQHAGSKTSNQKIILTKVIFGWRQGFPAFNQQQKTFLRTTSVLTRVHCYILKGVGHDMLLNFMLKYVIKISIHVLSVVRHSSGQHLSSNFDILIHN